MVLSLNFFCIYIQQPKYQFEGRKKTDINGTVSKFFFVIYIQQPKYQLEG